MNRSEWLQWRRGGIGASDIAAILGISPWNSPWSLWADKCGLVVDDHETDEMIAGRWLELAVGPWFADVTGLTVAGEQAMITHGLYAWARATLDGLVFEGGAEDLNFGAALGGLEIKTTQPGRRWDVIPEHYQAQGQWQMFCANMERVWFAVLHGRRLEVYELERDQADIDLMAERAEAWWQRHVIDGEAPPVDGSDATLRALAALYPDHEPGLAADITDVAAAVADLEAARAAKKAAEAAEKAAKAVLWHALGDAEVGEVGGRPAVTLRTQERRGIDLDALRLSHPRAIRRFTTTTTTRVLRVAKKKETT